MKALFQTDDTWTGLVLRITLGLVMFPHGAQKLLGWYGGFGFFGTMGFFTETMHLPWIVALLVIVGEFFGSLGLIAGFLTRFTVASFVVIMLGAIATSHLQNGFFMNWFGKQQGRRLRVSFAGDRHRPCAVYDGRWKMVTGSAHCGENR
jgi:putative oxidoreductase